jgi:hypothetical protein
MDTTVKICDCGNASGVSLLPNPPGVDGLKLWVCNTCCARQLTQARASAIARAKELRQPVNGQKRTLHAIAKGLLAEGYVSKRGTRISTWHIRDMLEA